MLPSAAASFAAVGRRLNVVIVEPVSPVALETVAVATAHRSPFAVVETARQTRPILQFLAPLLKRVEPFTAKSSRIYFTRTFGIWLQNNFF